MQVPMPNLYSPHSWLGMLTFIALIIQVGMIMLTRPPTDLEIHVLTLHLISTVPVWKHSIT